MAHSDRSANLAQLAIVALVFFAFARARPFAPPARTGPRVSPRNMTLGELRALASRAGFADPDTAAAIAMAESSGNPNAKNIVTQPRPGFAAERSFGLWQINTRAHPQFDEASLLDPEYNAQAALAVSSHGTVWSPWSSFQSGVYRAYMPSGPNA